MAEPKVRNKDRMIWPLLILMVAVAMLFALFYNRDEEPNVQASAGQPVSAEETASATTDPAQVIEIANLNLMPLENPAPDAQSLSVNLQGEVTNKGDSAAQMIMVEAQFFSQEGTMVHTQTEPLVPVKTDDGMAEGEGSFQEDPLDAGETRPFRIALGPVPQEWDREPPRLRVVQVTVP